MSTQSSKCGSNPAIALKSKYSQVSYSFLKIASQSVTNKKPLAKAHANVLKKPKRACETQLLLTKVLGLAWILCKMASWQSSLVAFRSRSTP